MESAATATAEKGAGVLRSPVSWALLGLVIHRPSYGYKLVQRFERTHGDALELSSPSQIYTALDTLERHGLIEPMVVEGDDLSRQPKPHYRATAAGVRDYRDWLVSQLRQERRRSRLFARQLAMLPPSDALAVIERCEQACLDQATGTRPLADKPSAQDAANLAERLVGEEERLAVGARLAWIEYARRQFEALASPIGAATTKAGAPHAHARRPSSRP